MSPAATYEPDAILAKEVFETLSKSEVTKVSVPAGLAAVITIE